MYNNATRRPPALDDPLRDNHKGNSWDEGTNTSGGTCAFTGGAYHVSQSGTDYFENCTGPSFSNFIFEVQMKIIKGNGGGVIFRADPARNTSYVFFVNSDGYYQLLICGVNNCNPTMVSGTSSTIKQGLNQTNLIAVIAQTSTIGLFVNHQLIDRTVDTNYSSGQIGVIAYPWGFPGGTEVVYSNAKVWTV
jgi:eukaryotic-like serine/threonine-protein kinase